MRETKKVSPAVIANCTLIVSGVTWEMIVGSRAWLEYRIYNDKLYKLDEVALIERNQKILDEAVSAVITLEKVVSISDEA